MAQDNNAAPNYAPGKYEGHGITRRGFLGGVAAALAVSSLPTPAQAGFLDDLFGEFDRVETRRIAPEKAMEYVDSKGYGLFFSGRNKQNPGIIALVDREALDIFAPGTGNTGFRKELDDGIYTPNELKDRITDAIKDTDRIRPFAVQLVYQGKVVGYVFNVPEREVHAYVRKSSGKKDQLTIGTSTQSDTGGTDAPNQANAPGGGVGGCFTSETKVAMSDGSLKEISSLKIGDKVKSFDFGKKRKVSSKVTALFTFDKESFLHLNGLKVTEMHPFAVGVDSWKEAGKLRIGDQVLGNNKITIKNIKRVNRPVSVFNITVDGTHNYYVDDKGNSFLVHNKGAFACFIKESKVTMADKSTKNIEKIKIGDKVLGFNLKTKKWDKYSVTELQKGKKKGYYVINKKLKVSPVHQIYVNGERKTAPEIRLNDSILNGHKKTRVTSIEYVDKKADRHNIVLGRNKDVLFLVNDIFVFNGW